MKRATIDFETRSRSDLKKEGAFKYSLDPSTQATCLSFKIRNQNVVYLLPFEVINLPWKKQDEMLKKLWSSLINDGYQFSSHNAFFEKCIYENVLVKRFGWPKIPFDKYRCTAAKAAACALPRNLEGAGLAMKLRVQKDKRGYTAMMATCKPNKKTGEFLSPTDRPDIWKTLYDYCRIDVRSEEELDIVLPDLNPVEQEIWFLNQELNWRGLRIDIPTVKKIVAIMEVENKTKLKELDKLTMGLVTKPGSWKSILEFLELEGVKLPNLQKQTVEDVLKGFDLSKDMRSLLLLRKNLSLTSTKKYQSFLNRAGSDERVRDILMYHGASTGRDTGTGIQPHNFPRLSLAAKENPYGPINDIVECDPEMLRILYGQSLGVLFSSVLRNMIIPTKGHELFVADFSRIEVAVLWWLAGCAWGLEILRGRRDPYKYMASANTGKEYGEISDEGDDRQLGKAQILGCGFGMGWEKFQKTAWDMHRLKLNESLSKGAVAGYRQTFPEVPWLWKKYENAAINAVEGRKIDTQDCGRCNFNLDKGFLWVRLPSGRELAYRDPQVTWRETEFGPRKTLEFWAVNSKTKKWNIERTWGGTLTENIVQAVARDLMMQGIVRLEKAGYKALLTVHDEAICEKPVGRGDLTEFIKIMCEIPKWAKECPIEAKGWQGLRYRK